MSSTEALTDDELAMLLRQSIRAKEFVDRRSEDRRHFRCLRAAANLDCTHPSLFLPILCQDISAKGIGFLSPVKPSSESVIVRLSADDQKAFIVASKVAYCTDGSPDADFPFVVGCSFTKRLA